MSGEDRRRWDDKSGGEWHRCKGNEARAKISCYSPLKGSFHKRNSLLQVLKILKYWYNFISRPKKKLLRYYSLNEWRGQKDLEGDGMINQGGMAQVQEKWSKAKLLRYCPLNEWRGQKDLVGYGMINQEGSGTGAREMNQGKTLALLSFKWVERTEGFRRRWDDKSGGNGTGARKLEQGKTLAPQSLK